MTERDPAVGLIEKLEKLAEEFRYKDRYEDVGEVITEAVTALRAAWENEAERERSFNMRWAADQRAIKAWQEANPGNDLVWPDHTDLCLWLMYRHVMANLKDAKDVG